MFFDVNAAFAHIPHDTVIETKLSPNYAQDRTVYHIVDINLNTWGNLFKSEDKGSSKSRHPKLYYLDNSTIYVVIHLIGLW